MSFFNSDIVRAEMTEIQELQEEIYEQVMKFPYMNNADKAYHIELLEILIEKQKVMYARLSLSDDPQAKQMKKEITESAAIMGLPKNVDMNIIWRQMADMIGLMKQQLDISQN